MESTYADSDQARNQEIISPDWLDAVQKQIRSLRFGVIQIVVHDSRVVQIDRTEKLRFESGGHRADSAA
jgi:hypothetical protein